MIPMIVLSFLFQEGVPQDTIPAYGTGLQNITMGGFFRGGFYSWIRSSDNKLYVPDAFSDLGLTLQAGNGKNYNAFADLRYRYGSQFSTPVSRFDLKEGFIKLYGKKWDVTAGQKIIKRGRADFTNPASKLAPQDYLYRSPDRDDMDVGNLLSEVRWHPSPIVDLEAVIVPFYRASTLIIDPVPLPSDVSFKRLNSIIADSKFKSYGLKADFHLKGVDWSFSWFDGFDPMPGIAMTKFMIDPGQPLPVPSVELSETPYRNRVAAADFETAIGNFGLRGEGAWSSPSAQGGTDEYVPLPDLKWVAGLDWFSGNWHFIGEYSGKYVARYYPSPVKPLTAGPDYTELALLLSDPSFDLREYVREEVAAFNRLYNYQLKRYYHSFALRIETNFLYDKIVPSLFSSFNFTSHELFVIPELKIKPSDGLTITTGAEVYSGPVNSLFSLINDFMNGFYVSLRVDF